MKIWCGATLLSSDAAHFFALFCGVFEVASPALTEVVGF